MIPSLCVELYSEPLGIFQLSTIVLEISIVFSVDYPSRTNCQFHCYNNRSGSWCVKASQLVEQTKSLTHDGEFTGECNMKIVQNYDVTYQMKELVLLNINII